MGEAYLAHSISEVLSTFFDQVKFRARNNFAHPVLSSATKGRKPEVDYVVEDRSSAEMALAVEAKWAGSSHCTAGNILWDLVRLKVLKDSVGYNCKVFFLLAGRRDDIAKVFESSFFKPGTKSPLTSTSQRLRKFNLLDNPDHNGLIVREKEGWLEKYPDLYIPDSLSTRLVDDARSANDNFRFSAKIWVVE